MFSGVIRGQNVTMLAFQTAGRVATMDVSPSDLIEPGQVIATLDDVTLEQDLASARAALEATEAEARLAASQLDRTETLFDRGIASDAELERARANRESTAAQVESARAEVQQAEDAARYATLTASRPGLVLSTEVDPGTVVSAGTGIVQVADPDGREAVIDIPEVLAETLPSDSTFEIRHHSQNVPPVIASLRLIEPVTQTSLNTRRLRLRLEDPPPDYRIGSLITATLESGGEPLIAIPVSAITGTEDEPKVWVVSNNGEERKVHLTPVTIDYTADGFAAIKDGLEAGDEIVTRGVHSLEDGQTVGVRIE
ncbi:efflux RND transporter periplasmic adaptor subunit [Pseudoruegeria sp. HB172150]|uniref:efflux RND transporter periplasmic adaptor subunit n=1 Tax=Pseudoruegeria sp. HB172150 TaxID=2721164 RepID=UPI001554E1C1